MSDGHYIGGQWLAGGGAGFDSTDPATGEVVWSGRSATEDEIAAAVDAARGAQAEWEAKTLEERMEVARRFAEALRERKEELSLAISREVGKPRWESALEVASMVGKIELSIRAIQERRRPVVVEESAGSVAVPGGMRAAAATLYKPHGVVAVFGPFNMPGHLPNGHIVPALLAGNAVAFKPSELTPLVGAMVVEAWEAAGLPPGVVNLVHGGRETGAALARHEGLDGIFFTGSVAGGLALNRQFADRPGKILALEMGGNNPLVVHGVADVGAAAYLTIQSAFITSGQRCSCARRLIVTEGAEGDRFVQRLAEMMRKIRVGPHTMEPEPFMGPVISDAAAGRLLSAQEELVQRGANPIVAMASARVQGSGLAMLSPGLVDVTDVVPRADDELFGPVLQLIRVPDFDAAVREANNTGFGLVVGLLCDDEGMWERFYRASRAGVVYWNRHTTGASSELPFGGTGLSGNHRPSGYFAADYCSYPVAAMTRSAVALPEKLTPGIEL